MFYHSQYMNDEKIPILVACGQITDKGVGSVGMTPPQLMAEACEKAAVDSGTDQLLSQVDTIATSGLTVDAPGFPNPLSNSYTNLPKTVANLLGIEPNKYYYAATGGNTPQMLVNHFAGEIAAGRTETVLLTGGEALRSMASRFNHWSKLLWPKGAWSDKPGGQPTSIGDSRPGTNKYEELYGLGLPANIYPLFENALGAYYQQSKAEHIKAIGDLFHGFSEVAEQNPHAWFQRAHTAESVVTPSLTNRMIAYPYTKLLNSMLAVNQAAALILTTVSNAKSLCIDSDKWIYLHGSADLHDIWNISERVDYHSSPAMRESAATALSMANKSIDDIAFFDIYSCFPSAVQIACDEFGIKHNDTRGLTLTGGLPYFGGPGNNYSMHGIVEVMYKLREHPKEFGMVNANGWYLTKHSIGIYSNSAPKTPWVKPDLSNTQQRIIETKAPTFTEDPDGKATVETYTVIFNRDNEPECGIVVGRLNTGERFLAKTTNDSDTLNKFIDDEVIGISGQVIKGKRCNIFQLS